MNQEVEIFLSYSHRDERLAKELREHLSILKQKNPSIYIWSADNLLPGQAWEQAVLEHMQRAQIILLLVSSDFLASNKELSLIEAKQRTGTILVIPIILRPTDWSQTFFAKLQSLPANGTPLSMWKSRDLAYLEIVNKIEEAIEALKYPTQVDYEEKQLRKILETFSERDLLTLCLDLRLNIRTLLDDTSEKTSNGLPKISIDRLLKQMEEQGRVKELANYIRRNRPSSN